MTLALVKPISTVGHVSPPPRRRRVFLRGLSVRDVQAALEETFDEP